MIKLLYRILFLFAGIAAGVCITEISLRLLYGDPANKLKQNSAAYSFLEPYKNYFVKFKNTSGQYLYRSQRSATVDEMFSEKKPEKTRRVFIVGESTAYNFGLSKNLFLGRLNELMPGLTFEVINCGTRGYDSQRILPIVRELVNYSPDLIVLFLGNNEMYGSVSYDPWLSGAFGRTIYERSWTGRILHDTFKNRFVIEKGIEDNNEEFKENLSGIIECIEKRNIPAALCTLPENYRDAPPFHMRTEQDPPYFMKEFFMGVASLDKGHERGGVTNLLRLAGDPDFRKNPYLSYTLARSLEKAGDVSGARKYYLQSLELDADCGGYRCPPSRNEIIRQKEGKSRKLVIVDLDKAFSRISPAGLSGDESFIDNCHWWLSYNDLVAYEVIRAIHDHNDKYGESILSANNSWRSKLKKPDMKKIFNETNKEIGQNCLSWRAFAIERSIRLKGRLIDNSIYLFKRVYRYNPELLGAVYSMEHNEGSEILRAYCAGDLVDKLDETWYSALCHAGEAYREAGDYTDAIRFFDRSIKLKEDQVYAYLFRGLIYYRRGENNKAREDWGNVIKRDGRFYWLKDML